MPAQPDNETSEGTVHFRLDPKNLPTMSEEEMAQLDAHPVDCSDIPELPPSFFEKATRS